MDTNQHKAGFVNIIGLPNVGKSTLLNSFMGEKMAIVSPKPQTTRQRLFGILNQDNYQVIFSDSPGYILNPSYKLHEDMNSFVMTAFQDADIVLLVTDDFNEITDLKEIISSIGQLDIPKAVVINKIDKLNESRIEELKAEFNKRMPDGKIFTVSAIENRGVNEVMEFVLENLPLHPPFYPKDDISDKPVRFFVSEMVREKIFLNFRQEIPYSCEVITDDYKVEESIVRIRCIIFVERESQKGIILGKGGSAIKKIGTEARKDIEEFIGSKVFLELTVKVRDQWRNDINTLRKLGYR